MSAERWWNQPTQTASREALDEIHLRRIRHLVAWAYEHSQCTADSTTPPG